MNKSEAIQSLSELRQFRQVAVSGSFSSAAKTLNQTSAAVSAGVKRLESHLGVRLLERSTRTVSLTEEGLQFFQDCQRFLSDLDQSVDKIRKAKSGLTGHLTIGAPGDLARGYLIQWIKDFQGQYPDITFDVRVSDTLADLQKSSINLAIRFGVPTDSSLIVRPMVDTQEVACASPAYLETYGEPSHPQELTQHTCLCYRVKGLKKDEWTFFRDNEINRIKVVGALVTDDSSIARQWAIEGLGVVYKSLVDVREDIRQGRLVRLFQGYRGQSAPLYVIYPSRDNLPERARAFIDFLALQGDRIKNLDEQ